MIHVLHPPVLTGAYFAEITAEIHKASVTLPVHSLLPCQNGVDLRQHEQSAHRFSLGRSGAWLVRKLIKDTKRTSRAAD